MLEDLKYLKVNLPEDILKLRWAGYFEEEVKLIDLWLNKQISTALRKRLEQEKEIIRTIKEEYTYSFDQAFKKMKDNIENFTEEEMITLQQNSQADWILVEGKVMFNDSFYGTLLKTRSDLAARLVNKDDDDGSGRREFLNQNIKDTMENKAASYFIHMKSTVKIKDQSEKGGEKIKVHIPIPAECQQSNIKIIKTIPDAAYIAPENHPSRTAYFEVDFTENQEFSVEYSYESHLKYNEPEPSMVSKEQPCFDTCELEPHIMFTPYIKELAEEIIGDEMNTLLKARRIYDYITQNVKYSYVRAYSTITNIPEYAALNLKGDCGVQALLFITLCRCSGIPAKWQSGLAVTPYGIGPHDWAQFYVEPFGWLFADPSFGGGEFRNNPDKWNFYFANLDPFRMVANSEFQHEFDPPKKHLRHDPYDNQVGEAEYEDRGLLREEYTVKWELIDMHKILKE